MALALVINISCENIPIISLCEEIWYFYSNIKFSLSSCEWEELNKNLWQ